MDAQVKAKFYQVQSVNTSDPHLFESLQRLWDHPERTTYQSIFGGMRVRLERFESDPAVVGAGFVDGEIVRQQTDNIPPIAAEAAPLVASNSPIGHRCAFRYHPELRILLLESRQNGVTPVRLDGLIKSRLTPHRGFYLYPVITENALERLRNGNARRVSFRVASPANMRDVEGADERRLTENLSQLANNFSGRSIEVSV